MDKLITLFENLIKDYRSLTLALGVGLTLISALDKLTIQKFSFNINDTFGRAGIAAIGVLLIFYSLGIIPMKSPKVRSNKKSEDYAIKIEGGEDLELSPFILVGAGFNTTEIKVKGTLEDVPESDKSIWLFHVHYGNETLYFPQRVAVIDKSKKTWSGTVKVGKSHAENSTVLVALAGKSGSILCNYYMRVVSETGAYIAFRELPPDIEKCDERNIK